MMEEIQNEGLGESFLSPVKLEPRQAELCNRLDSFYASYNLGFLPSDVFRGVIFAARKECRSNPDWLAQATHSLREILYPLHAGTYKIDNKKSALEKFHVVNLKKAEEVMGTLWNKLNEPAHHREIPDFPILLNEFEMNMLDALQRQIDVHYEIASLIAQGPPKSALEQSIYGTT